MSRVSVVIPCHNAEPYIVQAIDSIRRQTHQNWELIIVDDGSSDASVEVIEACGCPLKLLRQSASGPGAALNLGMVHCTGEYVAFLDADDLWVETKLELQLQALRENPSWQGAFCQVEQFRHEDGATLSISAGPHRGALLVSRSACQQVGLYRVDLKVGEFLDWYGRAQDQGLLLGSLAHPLYRRRIHDTNLGIRARDSRKDYVTVLKQMLDRRRAQNAE